jgi:HSP20 family protein
MAQKQSEVAPRSDQELARKREAGNPFRMLERFADEVDRMFDDFGLGRGFSRWSPLGESVAWTPRIDIVQRNNELVVRADLPGLGKDDVKVDVTEDAVVIQGERHREHEEEQHGVYRTERSYGSFYRAIPLPDGAITDQAKAQFKDGVLEITMPAPPEHVTRGRRLEISEGESNRK